MAKSVFKRIKKFNKFRHPERVKLKYEALLESPFRFFRGTCHLFYDDLSHDSFIFSSPRTWICGDLHLENFGSFKGVHRLYFDINDFDEAFLGPCLLDIVRLCTSLFLINETVKFSKAELRTLISSFLLTYADCLRQGDAEFLEHGTARGFIRGFLDKVVAYQREHLMEKRIKQKNETAKIKCDNIKTWKCDKPTRHKVKKAVAEWVHHNFGDPDFFHVIDVAIRTSGTGSIGIDRYLVLVKGNEADGHYLLDIKETLPATGLYYLKIRQPKWNNEATRLISIQSRVQAGEPVFLSEIKIEDKCFVIKEMQPEEDKIDYRLLQKDTEKFTQLMHDLGAIVAWNTLRCGGRQGSAIADDMIRFGKRIPKLEKEIISYSEKYAARTIKYYNEYKKEYTASLKQVPVATA